MRDVLYVLSPGHSGSTLLGLVLGALDPVATVGELKRVPVVWRADEPCSCGQRMQACVFWQQVQSELVRSGPGLDDPQFATHYARRSEAALKFAAGQIRSEPLEWVRRCALRAWPAARRSLEHLLECNRRIIDAILRITGRSVFLDTSKDAARLRYLLDDPTLRLRVVHLVRDGRAVACSLIRKGREPQDAAREWVSEHEQALRLLERVDPARWCRVRYEDFCREPLRWLNRICDVAGLPPVEALPAWYEQRAHVIGNRMRLRGDSAIRLDETWRQRLSARQLEAIERIAGPLNRGFGYQPAS